MFRGNTILENAAYFERLAACVHPFESAERWFGVMIIARCDESADTRGTPFAYVICGLIGEQATFVKLERSWKAELEHQRISEFHMSALENRNKPYEHLEREQRDHIQRVFIQLILDSELGACASVVDLQCWNEILATARAQRGKMADPYFLAFQHVIEEMATVLDEAERPSGEVVAFTFDQQKEYEGHAKRLYDDMQRRGNPHSHRLGALVFDSRKRILSLQAADLVAYENLRYVRDVIVRGDAERWQMALLRGGGRLSTKVFGREAIDVLARQEGWIQ